MKTSCRHPTAGGIGFRSAIGYQLTADPDKNTSGSSSRARHEVSL
jgi:hypothetical protein